VFYREIYTIPTLFPVSNRSETRPYTIIAIRPCLVTVDFNKAVSHYDFSVNS